MSLSARAPRAGDPFWDLLVQDAHAWGINPRDLALIMVYESIGLDPNAMNAGGAVGINQITNYANFAPLTRDQYRALDASGQWQAGARKFFDGVIRSHPGVKEGGARDLYWLNFVPATYKAGVSDDYIIIEPTGQYGSPTSPLSGSAILRENPSLVLPQDRAFPVIRAGGLMAALEKNLGSSRWREVLGAIDAAEAGAGIAQNGPGTRPSAHPLPGHPVLPKVAEASMMVPALVIGAFGIWAWAKSRRLKGRA